MRLYQVTSNHIKSNHMKSYQFQSLHTETKLCQSKEKEQMSLHLLANVTAVSWGCSPKLDKSLAVCTVLRPTCWCRTCSVSHVLRIYLTWCTTPHNNQNWLLLCRRPQKLECWQPPGGRKRLKQPRRWVHCQHAAFVHLFITFYRLLGPTVTIWPIDWNDKQSIERFQSVHRERSKLRWVCSNNAEIALVHIGFWCCH